MELESLSTDQLRQELNRRIEAERDPREVEVSNFVGNLGFGWIDEALKRICNLIEESVEAFEHFESEINELNSRKEDLESEFEDLANEIENFIEALEDE